MNLRELAKKDAAHLIEGNQAGWTECTLSDLDGNSWTVKMQLSDIGYSVDTDGNQVAGRTCWATYIADRVQLDDVTLVPQRGWSLSYSDLEGVKHDFSVLYCQPDITVGLRRIYLVVDLEADDE